MDKLFSKVLIANRGEIACRIIKTLKKMGIKSAVVYSDADRNSLPTQLADEAIHIGNSPSHESYLDFNKIISVAKSISAEAIHPGYGFLSENVEFAKACEINEICFIGPTPSQLKDFGLKHVSKEIAKKANVPLIPGTGILTELSEAIESADFIGYPVMLKSSAGGGGIGMRLCHNNFELEESWEKVLHLSKTHFGSAEVFLEKYIEKGRHIEVQIFGDGNGKIITLGTRDCSVQRRNQKVIEEAPAPNLDVDIEKNIVASAQSLAEFVKYKSAGTVEFIYDITSSRHYFLEVNTRLQVEHGVTEEVYSVDLVEWMVRQAAGPNFLNSQKIPEPDGHAMEFRWYAENPLKNFMPCAGKITRLKIPEEIRCDSWVQEGQEVSTFYDPLLAKLISKGKNRQEAILRLKSALEKSELQGLYSNKEYVSSILSHPDFIEANVHTQWANTHHWKSNVIEVLEGGAQTTIQDFPGRLGYWEVGVPPSGPMDNLAFQLGNSLLKNNSDAAGLEITLKGPSLKLHSSCEFCLTGSQLNAFLEKADGTKLELQMYTSYHANSGDILNSGSVIGPGMRAYILFKNGLNVFPFLGSCSTFTLGQFGGLDGKILKPGDMLPIIPTKEHKTFVSESMPKNLQPEITNDWKIGCMIGPHSTSEFFLQEDIQKILEAKWKVHFNSNRTGIRLIGPKPTWARKDGGEAGLHPSNIHDNAYAIGTMDFTGDMPVLLGPDGPSLGGFVCPLTCIQSEVWKLGQLKPGDSVQFYLVGGAEANSQLKSQNAYITNFLNNLPSAISLYKPENTLPSPILKEYVNKDGLPITIRQAGDSYMLLEIGELHLDLEYRFRIQWIWNELKNRSIEGITDLTPGIRSLQIHYDSFLLPQEKIVAIISELETNTPPVEDMTVESRVVHLPLSWNDEAIHKIIDKYIKTVRSDAPWCPDNIEFIRRVNGMPDVESVKNAIFDASYLVMGLGDVYLGAPVATPLDPRHRFVTTKYNPARTWTLENVVGIGGAYMCIYGMEGPGGYQLFGRTCQVWNSYCQTDSFKDGLPWLLRLFDQIRFYPVSENELQEFRKDFLSGKINVQIEKTKLNLGEYKQFLNREQESIQEFQTSQRKAFQEEREQWEKAGLMKLSEEISDTQMSELGSELGEGQKAVSSNMPGNIWKILVEEGKQIEENETVMILESMKMEFPIKSEYSGVIKRIFAEEGQIIEAGQMLCVLEEK